MKKLMLVIITLFAFSAFSQTASAAPKTSSAQTVKAKLKQTKQSINLNTAGVTEIAETLTGVGLKKAKAIVAYRNSHGKFNAIEELAAVKGIGVATIAKNKSRIFLK